jgi:hypothetical protein
MAAFEITINGKPYCQDEDISVVTIVAEPRPAGDRISIHARSDLQERLEWLGPHLKVGDEIAIRIVETPEPVDAGPTACGFCGRDAFVEVSRLVEGDTSAICDLCVSTFSAAVRGLRDLPPEATLRNDPDCACSFCHKRPDDIPGVVCCRSAAICAECLRACADLMADIRPE